MVKTPLDYYRLSAEETLTDLNSRRDGLNEKEVAGRQAQYGANTLEKKHKERLIFAYLRQFKDLMILLLLASSAITLYLHDVRTSVVLLVLVIFNTTIGFVQEYKAEKIMESLAKLVVAGAVVIRDGKRHAIPSSELTIGDIVYIEEGDAVPADLRVIEESELNTNDFALTGESNPSRKFVHAIQSLVPLANRHNLAFMGTTVAIGNARGVVIGVGMNTELGRIANLSQAISDTASPLQREINNIATKVTQGTVLLCAILLPIATYSGLQIKEALLFAIGFASSIIPQGMPLEVSTALAQAAGKLARAKALIKRLSAVESLGATSVICTDKTGTLTKNQMTIEQFFVGKKTFGTTGRGYDPAGQILDQNDKPLAREEKKSLELFFTTGAFASNARVSSPDHDHDTWYTIGDPTEGALMTLAQKGGIGVETLDKNFPEIKEFAFDSARKRMSSIRHYKDARYHVFAKGAPENILKCCTSIWENGKIRKLTKTDRDYILNLNEEKASEAMRNLGLAYRILPEKTDIKKMTLEKAESELVWLGMVSMIDPLREQVPNAMIAARRAHVKVCIVTGDFATTAKAIALRAKLTEDPKDLRVVSGEDMSHLSDSQILGLATRGGTIFSRVSPEDKLRIVALVQASGKVVAVTGDGINDAPALKRADIGVAMGLAGTEVAKESADLILLDDSFTSLVNTIQEGRTIYQNIQKGILCCFTSNASELIVNIVGLVVATLLHVPLALSVMQILAIDLIAEIFPIAALGRDKADGVLMDNIPRNPKNHILNFNAIVDLLWCGVLTGGFAFFNYMWFFERHGLNPAHLGYDTPIHYQATALTYLTLVVCGLFNILQRRTAGGLFSKYQFHNRWLWIAMGLSIFCVINIIYNPWINSYFKTAPLDIVDLSWAFLAGGLFITIRESQRLLFSSKRQSD